MAKLICKKCNSITNDSKMLIAKNPFDKEDIIIGCPVCKSIDTLFGACDEVGCNETPTCGFPTPDGYRRTCGEHYCENPHNKP